MAYLGFGKGGHGERAEREPITGVQGQSPWSRGQGSEASAPSGVQGQSPWRGGQGGEAPLKLKHFLLLNVQWKPQIRPFFWKDYQTLLNFAILAGKWQKRTFSYKVACKKISWSGQRGGGHRTMAPLNTPLITCIGKLAVSVLQFWIIVFSTRMANWKHNLAAMLVSQRLR